MRKTGNSKAQPAVILSIKSQRKRYENVQIVSENFQLEVNWQKGGG